MVLEQKRKKDGKQELASTAGIVWWMIVYQNKKNVDLPYRNYLYVEIEIEKSDCTIIDSIINLLFFYINVPYTYSRT